MQLSGSGDRGDDLEFDGGDIVPTEHDRDTVAISYAFHKNDHRFEFDIDHNDTGLTGTPALPLDIVFIRGENYKAAYRGKLNNGAAVSAQIHYQDVDHQMDNFALRNTSAPMRRFVTPDLEASDIRLSYNKNNWTVGFDADQANNNATVFNPDMAAFLSMLSVMLNVTVIVYLLNGNLN